MIASKRDYKYYLHLDEIALGIEQSFWGRSKAFIINPIYRFERHLRKTEYYVNCKKSLIWKLYGLYLRYALASKGRKLGFEIPINVFGPGLGIAHTGTIIVNPKSRVGSNCRIHSCVYISTHFGCPTIGDNVFIGPGCIISGSIRIGNNVVIGANSYVDSSFQDNCTIAGNPAKIIKESVREGLCPPQDRVRLNL